MQYNSNAYYMVMISAAALKNVRSHKVQLKFYVWWVIVGVTILYKPLIYSRSVRVLSLYRVSLCPV